MSVDRIQPEMARAEIAATAELWQQPPAITFHREASLWLDLLKQSAESHGLLRLPFHQGHIDFIDLLRTELILAAGSALSSIHRSRMPTGLEQSPIQASPAQKSSATQGTLHRWWKNVHFAAYQIKRALYRYSSSSDLNHVQLDARTVLILSRTQGHISDALPIAHCLRQRLAVTPIFAVMDARLAQRVREHRFSAVKFFSRLPKNDLEARACLSRADDLSALIAGFNPETELFDRERLSRMSVATAALVKARAADVVDQCHSAVRLLEHVKPAVVVIGNPYTVEGRIAGRFATAYGYPSVGLEHGTIIINDPRWYYCPVDKVYVWGTPSQRALQGCGLEPGRIAVTGSPRHEAIFRQAMEGSAGRDPARAMILVATSGAGDQVSMPEHQRFIAMLKAAVAATPGVRWTVKLHPKDREELYREVLAVEGAEVNIITKGGGDGMDIFDYLRSSRALITVASAAALDAMCVRVPVITVDVWEQGQTPHALEFLARDCTRRVRNAEQLAAEVLRAWNFESEPAVDAAALEYAAEHFSHQTDAASKVVDQLAELINTRPQCQPDKVAK